MIDEELFFSFCSFMVNPEFIFGDKFEAVMLAKISELLINIIADIFSVNDPDHKMINLRPFF